MSVTIHSLATVPLNACFHRPLSPSLLPRRGKAVKLRLPLQHSSPSSSSSSSNTNLFSRISASDKNSYSVSAPEREESKESWNRALSFATSLYPVYVTVGGIIAFTNPYVFTWFVRRGPSSYSLSLATIMLSMGLSLRLEELLSVITNRPFQLLFGCAAQYILMPLLGVFISKALGLSSTLSAGLILLSCCPGGTASNVVTYIAHGDVPLSIVMTICTTFSAVFATPLLTQYLAGAYVPVDAAGLALSTLQVVLAPVLLGAWLQSTFPNVVKQIVPFSPLVAVLISSLLASSVFSANIGLLGGSKVATLFLLAPAVLLLHAGGFLLGYLVSILASLEEPQRRAISIEVGMQNSSLGVVLATSHFSSPLVVVPAAVSAVLMNIMGSGLAVIWKNFNPSEQQGE